MRKQHNCQLRAVCVWRPRCQLWCSSRSMATVFTFGHIIPRVSASISSTRVEFSRRRRLTSLSASKGADGGNTIAITQRHDRVLPLLQLRGSPWREESRFRELTSKSEATFITLDAEAPHSPAFSRPNHVSLEDREPLQFFRQHTLPLGFLWWL